MLPDKTKEDLTLEDKIFIIKGCTDKKNHEITYDKVAKKYSMSKATIAKWKSLIRSAKDHKKQDLIAAEKIIREKPKKISVEIPKRPFVIYDKEAHVEFITQEVPKHVQIAWNDLEGSIKSVFKKSKWPSKYASFRILKDWFESLPKK